MRAHVVTNSARVRKRVSGSDTWTCGARSRVLRARAHVVTNSAQVRKRVSGSEPIPPHKSSLVARSELHYNRERGGRRRQGGEEGGAREESQSGAEPRARFRSRERNLCSGANRDRGSITRDRGSETDRITDRASDSLFGSYAYRIWTIHISPERGGDKLQIIFRSRSKNPTRSQSKLGTNSAAHEEPVKLSNEVLEGNPSNELRNQHICPPRYKIDLNYIL